MPQRGITTTEHAISSPSGRSTSGPIEDDNDDAVAAASALMKAAQQ